MKILVINIPSGEPGTPFEDWVRNFYVPMTKRNMDLVAEPDTEFTFRFSKWGMGPERTAFYRYMDHLASRMVFFAAQHQFIQQIVDIVLLVHSLAEERMPLLIHALWGISFLPVPKKGPIFKKNTPGMIEPFLQFLLGIGPGPVRMERIRLSFLIDLDTEVCSQAKRRILW